jgi:hypothetical protein
MNKYANIFLEGKKASGFNTKPIVQEGHTPYNGNVHSETGL